MEMDALCEKLLETMQELIASPGSWSEKKENLTALALSSSFETDLSEFLGWWDVDPYPPSKAKE